MGDLNLIRKEVRTLTDKELRRMSRKELLELLLEQSRDNDRLKLELSEARQSLADKRLLIDRAGSIAEAAVQINQVFEAAQRAAEQYLDNIRELSGRQEQVCKQIEEDCLRKADTMIKEVKRQCQALETATVEKCTSMTQEAEEKADRTVEEARNKIRQLIYEQDSLRGLLDSVTEGS